MYSEEVMIQICTVAYIRQYKAIYVSICTDEVIHRVSWKKEVLSIRGYFERHQLIGHVLFTKKAHLYMGKL